METLRKSSGIKASVVKDLLRGLLENYYGVRTGLLASPGKPPIYFLSGDRFTVASNNLSKLSIRFKPFRKLFSVPLDRFAVFLLLSATS